MATEDRAERLHPEGETRLPAAISWVVETRGIRLIRPGKGGAVWLDYPRAAVWDLLARRYPPLQVIPMLQAIAGLDAAAAARLLSECVAAWKEGF